MQKHNYRIILKYSQLTLNTLTFPYYHVNKGCQFNYFELDQLIQNELQKDESKQFKCPVCHVQGQLQLDLECYKLEFQNQQNQFVINMKDQQIYNMQKSSYFDYVLCQEQELFELQKQFNSKIVSENQLTLQSIEDLNVQRNNEIFQIYRKCNQVQQPTLIGVINFKLILFYYGFKLKIELDIYDDQNKIKLSDFKYGQMTTKQVSVINNYIYLVVQHDKLYQLYRGNFNQIFQDNNNQPIFYVQLMPNYTLLGESRLLYCKNTLLMIGSIQQSLQIILDKASLIVEDQKDQNVVQNEKIKIPLLNKNSQLVLINNDQSLLFIGYDIIEKGVGFIKELQFAGQTISEIKQNIIKYPISELDFSFLNDNAFYLLCSDKLNKQRIQVTQITITRDRNSFQKMMKIKNHHNYMKVKIIPTTKQKVGTVICSLVGLMFEQSQTIFPGVMVFNDKDDTIEIELI